MAASGILARLVLTGDEMDSANTTGLPQILASQEIDTTSLIVGAGICGLSTAYHLAKRQSKDGNSLNSGVVAYQWFTGDLREIAEYSYKIYEQLARTDSTFKRTCGYHDHSILKLVPGRSPLPVQVSIWLNIPEAWHLEEHLGRGRAVAL